MFIKVIPVILMMLGVFMTNASAATEKAIFAGGCFWCMHAEFEGHKGVTQVLSGYTGGHVVNPTYEQVSEGDTGHVEAIEVVYDPNVVTYQTLLDIFWSNVDPLDRSGQFCDKGSQYMAGIFVFDQAQRDAATQSAQAIEKKLGQPVATFIRDAAPFYVAEDYHQSYYKKNQLRYKMYKAGCGRDQRLKEFQGLVE
jgi:peptide-methionine (S)-S-oxide reductase